MFNFKKKKAAAVNEEGYKRMYQQKCEEYERLAKDYCVVVANLQDLVSGRKALLEELEDERYRHDRYADYAREQDKQVESLTAQLEQLKSYLNTVSCGNLDLLLAIIQEEAEAHKPTQEELEEVFNEESV